MLGIPLRRAAAILCGDELIRAGSLDAALAAGLGHPRINFGGRVPVFELVGRYHFCAGSGLLRSD